MPVDSAPATAGGGNGFALEMLAISKSYGAVRALQEVSLRVRPGSVHAVLGENGAGKSTLIEILAGNVTPDSGEIRIDGEPTRIASAIDAARHGIAVVHQHLSLAPNVTVAENLFPAKLPGRFGAVSWRRLFGRAQTLLDRYGVLVNARRTTGELPLAVQQQVEIVRALSADAKVIALDEPTSSLSVVDSRALFERLRRLRDAGRTIIVITHYIDDALDFADEATVLRDGSLVGSLPIASATGEQVVRMMIGREVSSVYPERAPEGAPADSHAALEVSGLASGRSVRHVDLRVAPGEIVGLYGLVGAGRSELLQALFGLRSREAGEISVGGRLLPRPHRPRDAIVRGLAFLPEDRTTEGLFFGRSVAENICVPRLEAFGKWFVRERAVEADAERYVRLFRVRGSVGTIVRNLSGGNQQKVLFSRWLSTRPAVLMVDEPTRGVDIGTKAEIHRALTGVADEGRAVLMASSELPEVLGMSDRIYVMAAGRIVDELAAEEATADRLLTSASRFAERTATGRSG